VESGLHRSSTGRADESPEAVDETLGLGTMMATNELLQYCTDVVRSFSNMVQFLQDVQFISPQMRKAPVPCMRASCIKSQIRIPTRLCELFRTGGDASKHSTIFFKILINGSKTLDSTEPDLGSMPITVK
jgi:hypothetical protein